MLDKLSAAFGLPVFLKIMYPGLALNTALYFYLRRLDLSPTAFNLNDNQIQVIFFILTSFLFGLLSNTATYLFFRGWIVHGRYRDKAALDALNRQLDAKIIARSFAAADHQPSDEQASKVDATYLVVSSHHGNYVAELRNLYYVFYDAQANLFTAILIFILIVSGGTAARYAMDIALDWRAFGVSCGLAVFLMLVLYLGARKSYIDYFRNLISVKLSYLASSPRGPASAP